MTRKLVAVTAGLSTPSSTRLLTDQLVDATRTAITARGEDVEVEVIEVRDLAVDLAQMMAGGGRPSAALDEVRNRVSAADGLIAVTPVFTAGYSGLFKMFFDALDTQALNGMPVLAAATAGTARHALVLEHAMRPMLSYLHAVVVPTAVFAATEDFGSADRALTERIERAADELAALMVNAGSTLDGFAERPADRSRTSGTEPGPVTPFSALLKGHSG